MVSRRAADLLGLDLPLGDGEARIGGQQVFHHLDDTGRLDRDAEQAARGLRGHHGGVRTRLLKQMLVFDLAHRGDDLGVGREFTCRQRDQDGGVVTIGGDDNRLGMLGAGQPQHLGVGGAAADSDQAGTLGSVQSLGVLVDHHDVSGRDLVADHRHGGGPPLGSVADDDDVVTQSAPPALDLVDLARLRGEGLDGGTDQHDQECDA